AWWPRKSCQPPGVALPAGAGQAFVALEVAVATQGEREHDGAGFGLDQAEGRGAHEQVDHRAMEHEVDPAAVADDAPYRALGQVAEQQGDGEKADEGSDQDAHAWLRSSLLIAAVVVQNARTPMHSPTLLRSMRMMTAPTARPTSRGMR